MKINGKLRKYGLLSSVGGGIGAILIFILALGFFNPLDFPIDTPSFPDTDGSLLNGTASAYKIRNSLQTEFGLYTPIDLSYDPQVIPIQIQSNLANVDMQGLTIQSRINKDLERYGFALVDEGYEDIYEIYPREEYPKFITTDLCLHAYHVLYDISLRILEGTHFSDDFKTMLGTLRAEQISLHGTVTENSVQEAIIKNIAYLTVMLYLIDNTTAVPQYVEGLVTSELAKIDAGVRSESTIFGYDEDYTQYKVRGHYTRNVLLSNYFKAMMYAGRMGFLLQSPTGDIEMGINHTRMAMLLLSSFNATIGSETVWDYWDRVYQPTAFYVGASDDLTPTEYYIIWEKFYSPKGDRLANDELIMEIINEAKTFRKPKINSMFVLDAFEYENVTQGFRFMGQRFIPDSYIFQQLVHDKVGGRLFPNGLDVFSVFGSPRAEFHLQSENESYFDYNSQILKLRSEFSNLTDYDWTQNLYWLWLYSLFPLLHPVTEGYPGFMLSNAWLDKALMTVMGSWAELRHDTILYAKQSYTLERGAIEPPLGYVEPYPEVYARLGALVRLMNNGLEDRGLVIEGFSFKLEIIAEQFDRLVEISIKELENRPLNESDKTFINNFGEEIATIASFNDPEADPYVSEADDRMAIIADVHTDPNSGQVLEVGTGNPYVIYVVIQDHTGKLRLTRGGTFSYYEFKYPMTDRLNDEEWHEILSSNPPPLPEWVSSLLIIHPSENSLQLIAIRED
ncbi:MAG: DUF3160 domain-containing protein [Candidatus Heimdallarchaeota archaeon]|nr:MAG: DUF3160 domain-containing protein [Candidatus Heimdallarchaeota archaeon]